MSLRNSSTSRIGVAQPLQTLRNHQASIQPGARIVVTTGALQVRARAFLRRFGHKGSSASIMTRKRKFDYTVDFSKTDFRKHPELYQV